MFEVVERDRSARVMVASRSTQGGDYTLVITKAIILQTLLCFTERIRTDYQILDELARQGDGFFAGKRHTQ